LGLSFKVGTDDMRESPYVTLIETLIGKGYKIQIYDSEVNLAKILGTNKDYIEKEIPHISKLMKKKADDVILFSDIVVICKAEREYIEALKPYMQKKRILDLSRIYKDVSVIPEKYEGICW
jgi:GDP-mannose 6-dehydrogenase